jgi:hypothetical protein
MVVTADNQQGAIALADRANRQRPLARRRQPQAGRAPKITKPGPANRTLQLSLPGLRLLQIPLRWVARSYARLRPRV